MRRSDRLANTGRSIASLAHEINNPIDALSNILFMLRSEKNLSKNQEDLVGMAAHELDRLITIARQTLAPHRQALQPVVVTVNELLDAVCESFGRKLQQAGITVTRNYEADGQVKLLAGELRQVITNLISNAIHAMPNGGTLRLETRVHAPSVEIRVGDTGGGIRPENLEAIFKPFFTTKGERGLGVGLWVSRRIIEKSADRGRQLHPTGKPRYLVLYNPADGQFRSPPAARTHGQLSFISDRRFQISD